MKGGLVKVAGFVLLVLAAIVFSSSAFVVREWEQAIITQFGDPKGGPITEAGLHFKLPFVQDVRRFDKRIMEWDGHRNEVPTADKRFIWIDTTARWRISDPLLFLQSVRNETGAQSRLDDILDSATRDQISSHRLVEVVRESNRILDEPAAVEDSGDGYELASTNIERVEDGRGRDEIERKILASARTLASNFGIELIDIRIKRLNYREDVRKAVYERMISERMRIAERFRSEGGGRKAEILGEREREEKTISSEAERQALEVMAKADADAARIYAEAYEKDPEFYAFWRTLSAYEKTIGDNTTLVISPESALYRYLADPDE